MGGTPAARHRQTDRPEMLQRHGVEFNILCRVHQQNAEHPDEVYRFFKHHGVRFLQFIPIVEPREIAANRVGSDEEVVATVTSRSVLPEQFGRFLKRIYQQQWIRQDVGKIFIRDFDQALAAWSGHGPTLCVYAKYCGRAVAVEPNGDLYRCNHFLAPEYRLGNIADATIRQMVNYYEQETFGIEKFEKLPPQCRACKWLFACHGGCPKDRFLRDNAGNPGLNYLCEGFRYFFRHIDPMMREMTELLKRRLPPAKIMDRTLADAASRNPRRPNSRKIGRNMLCPCGSGKKCKNCCQRKRIV